MNPVEQQPQKPESYVDPELVEKAPAMAPEKRAAIAFSLFQEVDLFNSELMNLLAAVRLVS